MKHSTSSDSANRHANVFMRGQLAQADDTKLMQELQITGYSGEAQQTIEYAEAYGFTSVPLPPSSGGSGGGSSGGTAGGLGGFLGPAAEHFTSQANSGRSHGVTSAVPDRRHRLFKKQPGEVGVYDDQGQWFYLRRNQILIKAPNKNSIVIQVDQQSQQQSGGSSYGQDASKVPQGQSFTQVTNNTVIENAKQTITHQAGQTITRSAGQTISDQASSINHNGNTNVTGNLGVSQIITAEAVNTSSDRRLKYRIKRAKFGLAALMKIKVVEYRRKGKDHPLREQGFLAQQLHRVFPLAVRKGGRNAKKNPWRVDTMSMIALLVNAVQEQQDEIAALRRDIRQLRAR